MNPKSRLPLIVLLISSLCLSLNVEAQCKKKKGKCTIVDKDGFVHKGNVLDSLKTGVWKTYNEKKVLVEEITYVRGKESGPCKYYFPDDTSYTTGSYTNGHVDGVWSTYNSKGKLVHNVTWNKDTMNGPCFDLYAGHATNGQYTKGKKTGWWVESESKTGFVDSSYFVLNKKEGRAVTYRQNVLRSLGYWKDGKKNGLYYEYDSLGRRSLESYYKMNVPDSIYRSSANGILRQEYTFCNQGRYCGISTSWKANGKLDLVTSYDSTGNRIWYAGYDDEGRMARKSWFNKIGLMDSINVYRPEGSLWYTMIDSGTTQQTKNKALYQKFYYPNGKKQYSGYLVDSRRVGLWFTYDTSGVIAVKMNYDFGQLMGPLIAYYPNGKPKLVTNCFQGYADSIAVFDAKGKMVAHSDPLFNSTIKDVQLLQTDARFRNPNDYPAENGKKTKVELGDVSQQEITPGVTVPSFPGGEDSLRRFIVRNIRYPEPERRYNIQGEVKVRFLVNTDGSISEVVIQQEVSNGPGLTRETLKAIHKMPKWVPAKQGTVPQKAYYRLGVKFTLE